MNRFVVPMLAALVVSAPLSAQAPPKDTTKQPAALAKPGPKTDSAAGEVSRRDTIKAPKDSLAPSKDSAALAKDAAAAEKDASLITPQKPTYRCKDGSLAYVADSTKACGLRGGVDSVYKKPTP